ncbi:MAG TPA: cupin domain-containing protein [Deltaproteobacteria bacterium]|nr:cupin domain-containing protein [Deltaproteobacteria bacterium]
MLFKTYSEVDAVTMDNDVAKGIAARVVLGKADGACNFCMRVFEIAPNGHTPRHAHAWEHEMFIYSGKGEIFGNGKWNPVKAGDVVLVNSDEEHQIRNNSSELLAVVCLVPSGAPEL